MSRRYLFDANVFVQAKDLHYRFSFCGGFWDWIEAAHQAKLAYSVESVRAELNRGRTGDPARVWAQAQPSTFFLADVADLGAMKYYGDLIAWAGNGKQFLPAAVKEFARHGNADPFIVAVAKQHGYTVVTHEKFEPAARRRVPIPNAANHLGVRVTSIFDLLSQHATSTFKFKP